jgi:hypothetical protein
LKIKLATPVAGVLREVPVDRGDIIHKGEIVAQLESGVEKAMFDLETCSSQGEGGDGCAFEGKGSPPDVFDKKM